MDIKTLAAQALYLHEGKILGQHLDNSGYLLDPQPFVVRTAYVPTTADLEREWQDIQKALAGLEAPYLLLVMPSPDGPPYRTARLYYPGGTQSLLVNGGRKSVAARVYYPIEELSQPWNKAVRQLQPGFLVTGLGGPVNIWRIHRIEFDPWKFPLFMLAPLQLAAGFPVLDLSAMKSPERRKEIESHYDELQRCVLTSTHRGTIARAKDIAEALITERSKRSPSDTFHVKLEDIFARMKTGESILPWLTYTLCQKLRLVYKRTHPENALEEERPVTAELALSVVQDLIEILTDLGYAKQVSPFA